MGASQVMPDQLVECPQTCASSNISDTEICDATSEECLFGCQDGFYGTRCEHMCNATVKYCKKCSTQSDNTYLIFISFANIFCKNRFTSNKLQLQHDTFFRTFL